MWRCFFNCFVRLQFIFPPVRPLNRSSSRVSYMKGAGAIAAHHVHQVHQERRAKRRFQRTVRRQTAEGSVETIVVEFESEHEEPTISVCADCANESHTFVPINNAFVMSNGVATVELSGRVCTTCGLFVCG